MWKYRPLLLLPVIITLACPLRADDGAKQLAKLVEDAKVSYEPVSAKQVADLKQQLVDALKSLDAYLAELGEPAQSEWRKELALGALDASLKAETTDISAARDSLAKFQIDKEGLEATPILEARSALRRFERALLIQGNPNSKQLYEQQLTQLAAKLGEYEAKPTLANSVFIGTVLGNLELGSQAKPLVTAARDRFRRPNMRARVSKHFMSHGMSEPIDRTEQVNEYILGTSTSGTAVLSGNTSVALHPSEDSADLEILLKGVAQSTTVGLNRGVTIHSVGETDLNGGARISISSTGISAEPAWATAATGSTITGIWHKNCLVRKIAQKRVAESKGKAEVIASQRAANRLAGRIDRESEKTVEELNEDFLGKFRNPLLRKGDFPSLMKLATSADALSIIMTQANAYQLAAGTTEPPAHVQGLDLAVQLHESFVGNMSQGLIGGQTLTSEKLADTLLEMNGEVPEGLAGDNEPPWSITFSRSLPIRVTFDGQLITVSIRGRKFTRGDTVVRSEMEIGATYKVEQTDVGAKLTRQGDVTAEYTKKGFQRPEKIAIKTVMRKKFTALLKESRTFEGLEIPGRWQKVGKLNLAQMSCDNQWLVLGWKAPKTTSKNAAKTEPQPEQTASNSVE